ncbi:MAG: hypothetical protein WA735_19155, partial [Candidatus Acidiferrales bacterium]
MRVSDDDGFLVFTKGAPERVGNFADRGVRFDSGEDRGHEIFGSMRTALDFSERGIRSRSVAARTQ